ncbi:starvation-inducible DNA-binding protein [Pricia antarctica]|uniref:Starvation-inducible DNA-binding protein n=1 Tax=Pricia antarctica TaxID=641691 RepID=A0A1G7B6H4_9FLAO|nr:DNA starvation/stationary phase protection protein [Pricia antarctica]SDE22467.1 starvation-inducible DNA-binding protein [Pricia antarctica]
MKTNIGISKDNRQQTTDVLAKLLADEFLLYTKTLRAHWNLEGHDFHTKHLFFEEHYNAIKRFADGVAERIRKIGHYAPATMGDFLKLTHLTEKYEGDNTSHDFTAALLEDHDSIIQFIRGNIAKVEEEYEDVGTADFLTGLLQEHEEMAWMLRATIAKA